MATQNSLRALVSAIIANDAALFSAILGREPDLATAAFEGGATRQAADPDLYFVKEIGYCIYSGDTALHLAAAAYRYGMAEQLLRAGVDVRARNRRGVEALHWASSGSPGAGNWDPAAQVATIRVLVAEGADLNATNMDGATPLHRAVRTRCAEAVRVLLELGADPAFRNKSGSTPRELALHTTGRSGSGSSDAKDQQREILRLFEGR